MNKSFQVLEISERRAESFVTVSTAASVSVSTPPDPSDEQYMKIIEASGSLDFWNDEEEDIYGAEDGTEV